MSRLKDWRYRLREVWRIFTSEDIMLEDEVNCDPLKARCMICEENVLPNKGRPFRSISFGPAADAATCMIVITLCNEHIHLTHLEREFLEYMRQWIHAVDDGKVTL